MPKYYFDTDNGHIFVQDTEGIDLPDRQAVRKEALLSLADIVSNRSLDGGRRDVVTQVRDGEGTLIFVGTLRVMEEWVA